MLFSFVSIDSNLESIADKYVGAVLEFYKDSSFIIFRYGERTYAGVKQFLSSFEDSLLVRVIRIQQPPSKDLVDLLVKKANPPKILTVDDSIEAKDKGLFYASLHDGALTRLTPEEYKYLITKGMF